MKPNMYGRWAFVVIVVALLLASWNPAVAARPQRAGSELTVNVRVDFSTFDQLTTTLGGPFYVGGVILDPETDEEIGLFHCFGFFFEGGAVVTQEFDLTGRGKIILAGVEDQGPRAITGGTGDFKNVRGEATGIDLSGLPLFPVTFNLIGADG